MTASFRTAALVNTDSQSCKAVSRSVPLILLTSFLWLGSTDNVARAQSDREQRREFVQGLMRTFLEAQVERHLGPRHSHPPHVKPVPVSPTMNKARAILASFSQESGRLRSALHADASRASTPRRYVGNAFQVNAAATALANQATASSQLEPLVENVRTLDREWRLLSHRLQQVEGLSEACRRSVQQLDRYDNELCALFGVQPQIDHRELLRAADALAIDLKYLVQDIEIELGKSSKYRELVVAGRRVERPVICRTPIHAFNVSTETETVTNEGRQPLSAFYYYVDWTRLPQLPEDTPYFHAMYRQEYPCVSGRRYLVADIRGRGHYGGTVLSCRQHERGWMGEGDDFFFVDGEEEPSLRGTGTEDYFCDAWGFVRVLDPSTA